MGAVATIVDWSAIGASAAASLIAGVGIALAFSAAIYGGTRFAEARRAGEMTIGSIAAGVLAFVGLAVSIAGIAAGLVVVISG